MIYCTNCNEILDSMEAFYAYDDYSSDVPMCIECAPAHWTCTIEDTSKFWDSAIGDGLEDEEEWDE